MTAALAHAEIDQEPNPQQNTQCKNYRAQRTEEFQRFIHDKRTGNDRSRAFHIPPHAGE